MFSPSAKERRFLEYFLIALAVAITGLFYQMQGYKLVVLHLFYLPVVLTGFFLGRYRAGVIALLCVLSASTVAAINVDSLPTYLTPVVLGLAILVWGAALGLTSLLVGTLSDQRQQATKELHEAYVGVVEVLSQYLQSAHPVLKARSVRVAELSQRVAFEMRLSPKQIDDIRVAALLYETDNVEITTKVIRKAVSELGPDRVMASEHTFQGRDLVSSLGSVLSGATALLLELQARVPESGAEDDREPSPSAGTLGARIIRLVRSYDALTVSESGDRNASPEEALDELSRDRRQAHDGSVLKALKSCILAVPAPRESDRQEEPQLTS